MLMPLTPIKVIFPFWNGGHSSVISGILGPDPDVLTVPPAPVALAPPCPVVPVLVLVPVVVEVARVPPAPEVFAPPAALVVFALVPPFPVTAAVVVVVVLPAAPAAPFPAKPPQSQYSLPFTQTLLPTKVLEHIHGAPELTVQLPLPLLAQPIPVIAAQKAAAHTHKAFFASISITVLFFSITVSPKFNLDTNRHYLLNLSRSIHTL
jgi:hypothetical protein